MPQSKPKPNRFLNPLGLLPESLARRVKKPWTKKRIVRTALYAVGGLFGLFALMVIVFSFDLPKPGQIAQYHPVASTKILDRNGNLLYDIFGEEKRTVVSSEDIPKPVKDATVAVEDRYFYQHHGVNFRSVARAVFVDIVRGSKSQGGSTITQQLVRNAIDEVGKRKSFIRKIKEVILAVEFEQIHSKDEILTLYLNEVPYGNNFYGVEAAAQGYYGKHIKDLNPDAAANNDDKAKVYAQIATLVALPQSPTFYNPYGNHTDQLKIRRDIVLQKMAEQGYISEEISQKAKGTEIADGIHKSKESITAPHFVFYVREQLVDLLGGGQIGERRLSTEGYKVTTTLDLDKQRLAEKIITDKAPAIFKSTQASNTALVSTDAKTGQIIAMVGSVDFSNQTFGSVNVTTAKRQPGSSFKPLVYATLFKKGWSPGSTLFDLESTYDQARPGEIWPHNYSGGGRGPQTARSALAQSLNISAVKAQGLATVKDSVETAKDLGLTTLNAPDQYGLAMVLGAAEVRMTEMVGAFGAFGNNGELHPTASILKIEDQNGQVIQEWKDQPKKALDPGIAYQITSILSDNEARTPVFGSRSPLILSDRPVAAKTGTTSSYRDAWTIGYTPQYVTAVWVGNNNNKEMTHSGAGAMAAAPIWHDFMQQIHKGVPVEQFKRPDGVKDCSISRYSNKKPTQYTPEGDVVRDLCTDAQVPKDDDTGNKAVKVCSFDQDKLAPDDLPASLVTTKVYRNIHSERPDDPVWERPVQDWASGAGFGIGAIPKDKCDSSNADLTLSILSPDDNDTVTGTITLQAQAESRFGVSHMIFYIDGTEIGQPQAPWTMSYDTTALTNAKHTFKALTRDLQGQEKEQSVSFTVANNVTVHLSNVVATRSLDRLSVTITWATNIGADGLVQYGPTIAYGTSVQENRGNVTSHTVTIIGLNPLQTYHFKVTSKLGSESDSSTDSTF